MQVPPEITHEDIAAARARIAPFALRTPLVRANFTVPGAEVFLKLENLQPIGSFKLRGAANALRSRSADALADGVWTPSAGNMAQGVAWMARQQGIRCSAVVPDTAPLVKVEALQRLGACVVPVPFDAWWKAMLDGEYPADAPDATRAGTLVHPVADASVIAGNATIGAEILEQLPDVDAVLVPFGGGGLITGIAAALCGRNPPVRIIACEIETAAPLGPSLRAGAPVDVEYRKTFIDGIGSRNILPAMWPHLRRLADAAVSVSVVEAAAAVLLLAERHRVIAEGAGAVPVAAARAGRGGAGKVVCIVSGGNLDRSKLVAILGGGVPES